MQNDLALNYPESDIQLLGVNAIGHQGGNMGFTSGRDIPWLQDIDGADAWANWSVGFRDVIILDDTNTHVGTYNLTQHPLNVQANYNTLRQMLVDAAPVPEPSTLTLLAMAAVGIVVCARRGRSRH